MDEQPHEEPEARTWRYALRKVRSFFSVDRIIATVAILLIPCLFFAWARVPVGARAGLDISFSMPELVSTSNRVIDRAESVVEIRQTAEEAIDFAVAAISWGTEKLDTIAGNRQAAGETPEAEGA